MSNIRKMRRFLERQVKKGNIPSSKLNDFNNKSADQKPISTLDSLENSETEVKFIFNNKEATIFTIISDFFMVGLSVISFIFHSYLLAFIATIFSIITCISMMNVEINQLNRFVIFVDKICTILTTIILTSIFMWDDLGIYRTIVYALLGTIKYIILRSISYKNGFYLKDTTTTNISALFYITLYFNIPRFLFFIFAMFAMRDVKNEVMSKLKKNKQVDNKETDGKKSTQSVSQSVSQSFAQSILENIMKSTQNIMDKELNKDINKKNDKENKSTVVIEEITNDNDSDELDETI